MIYAEGACRENLGKDSLECLGTRKERPHGVRLAILQLVGGTHTIRLVVDANDDKAESNESDNEYTKTITVN